MYSHYGDDDIPLWGKVLIVILIAAVLIATTIDSCQSGKENRAFMQKCIEACRPQAVAETQKRYNNCVCDNTRKSVEVK